MNSDALQKENIELILKLMPTAEEISMITDQDWLDILVFEVNFSFDGPK